MQATGIKRARSPDDDGTCCGGARSAKSGRRAGGGPSTTPGGGGGGASSGASGFSGFDPGARAFVPGLSGSVPGSGGVAAPGPGGVAPGSGGVAPGSGGITPYAGAGAEEDAQGDDVVDAEEGGEMNDDGGDGMDIDNAPVNPNDSGSQIFDSIYPRGKVWNKFGAATVKTWNRDKVILYLPNLPTTFDSQWGQNPNFTVPLFQALRDALEGPDAVVNLTGLGADRSCDRVLGNEDAGRLFATLYADHRRLYTSRNRLNSVELGRPITNKQHSEEQALWQALNRLVPDVNHGNSRWLWDLLREASRKWMDTRFRNLRNNARLYNDGTPRATIDLPRQPFATAARVEMINSFIHGGDLRLDALMCQLEYGTARYRDRAYNRYLEELFQSYYGMSSEVGIWLSQNGNRRRYGIYWPEYVYTINAYVSTRESMLGNRGRNYSAISMADMHEQLFFPFAQRVADLVDFAKRNPTTLMDANLLAEADRYRYTLMSACQFWTDPSHRIQAQDNYNYEGPLWNHHDRLQKWGPATNFAQYSDFDPEYQIFTNVDVPAPPISPINVPWLLNVFGSGQRPTAGVPDGKAAP